MQKWFWQDVAEEWKKMKKGLTRIKFAGKNVPLTGAAAVKLYLATTREWKFCAKNSNLSDTFPLKDSECILGSFFIQTLFSLSLLKISQPKPWAEVKNQFEHIVTMLCRNKPLWLDNTSHVTCILQSECSISALFYYILPSINQEFFN